MGLHILLINGYAECYQEVNRPRREAFHSFPSIAEVKNDSSGVIRTFTSRTKLDVLLYYIVLFYNII